MCDFSNCHLKIILNFSHLPPGTSAKSPLPLLPQGWPVVPPSDAQALQKRAIGIGVGIGIGIGIGMSTAKQESY